MRVFKNVKASNLDPRLLEYCILKVSASKPDLFSMATFTVQKNKNEYSNS